MPVLERNGIKVWQRRDRLQAYLHGLGWLLGTLVFVACWQVIARNTRWEFVWDAPQQGAEMLSRLLPPRWEYFNELWQPLWDTLNIATLGTLLGVAIALPLSLLAARNTAPHPIVRLLALVAIVTSRSVNSLIWAMLLVIVVGPGVLAGTLAIGLRSIGFTGKLFYEAIEEIDPRPVEAIEATGASPAQVLTYAVLPQVFPAFAGISLYRWDINIRESTAIGLVGAGGIGVALEGSINTLRWSQVGAILLIVFITVVLSEWVAAKVREAIAR